MDLQETTQQLASLAGLAQSYLVDNPAVVVAGAVTLLAVSFFTYAGWPRKPKPRRKPTLLEIVEMQEGVHRLTKRARVLLRISDAITDVVEQSRYADEIDDVDAKLLYRRLAGLLGLRDLNQDRDFHRWTASDLQLAIRKRIASGWYNIKPKLPGEHVNTSSLGPADLEKMSAEERVEYIVSKVFT